MRPYLAIIKDSFREAIASRVLWILLSLIGLQLLLMAPAGIRLNLTTDFAWGDIGGGPELVTKLRRATIADAPSPGKRIWSLLGSETQRKLYQLEQAEEGENRDFFQAMEVLRTGLTTLIHRRDFYDEATWRDVSLSKECKDYLAKDRQALSEKELARMNRLLIEAAYPAHIRNRSPHSISLTYFGMDLSGPLPFSKEQADSFIKEWVLSGTMSTVVGIVGIIAAILVTSNIIPQMFEPGSITLLLSKPLSRSLLFISKFLGGCAFILLNVGFLVGGLWLILGTRFGIWNQGMLWCIPIFMFMFLIYYAVSALAGLIWKSPVISVVLTVVFWFSCFSVGTTKHVMEGLLLDRFRIVKVAQAEDTLVSVTEEGLVRIWDAERRAWQQVYEPSGRRGNGVATIEGPVYHAATKQLLFGQGFRNPFGIAGQRITLRVARAADGWALHDGPSLPSDASTFLLENDGSVLAVASDNVYRLRGEPRPAGKPIKVFGVTLPLGGGAEFRPVLADSRMSFPDPLTAASDPQHPRIALVSRNEVYLFTRGTDGEYTKAAQATLRGGEKEGSAVAIAGNYVVVGREDGTIWLLSARDLSVAKELNLESQTQPRFLAASAGGQVGILFQNRRLWLIDAATGAARRAPVSGQGDISGFAFSGEKLLVADSVSRVITYDGQSLARQAVYGPPMNRVELAYYYSVLPLYLIFPKPGELDNTVQYVLTGKRTTDLGVFRGDLSQRRENLHPWRPVRSGLAFVAVVLVIACIYMERHEF